MLAGPDHCHERPIACSCDAHLALMAFVKWGDTFPEHLIGDFACALWDTSNRRLILGRDPFGIRPLYYMQRGREIWWCSDISFLVRIPETSFTLDEEYVAGYLTATEDPTRTPYAHIRSVRPGSVVTAYEGRVDSKQFWIPRPLRTLQYRSDGDYEDQFRELFADSLRARLRAKGTVMAELSGGLDSSAIVCMSDRLIRQGQAEASRLETVSFIYDGSPTADERSYIAEVIATTGVPNYEIEDHGILSRMPDADDYFVPNPHRSYLNTYLTTEVRMRNVGARVLLTGLCGDHVFMHDQDYSPALAELLGQGRFAELHRLALWISRCQKASYWQTTWLGAIWPWLPTAWRVSHSPNTMRLPRWINPEFALRTQCGERSVLRRSEVTSRNPCSELRVSLLFNAISAASAQRYREHLCIEVCMPYLHLPLVQFLLDLPSSQLLRPGEDRSIQRRGTIGVLPEAVRTRTNKRSPDEAFLRAIRREWPYLNEQLHDPLISRLGMVNKHEFLMALERARFGYIKWTGSLFRAMSFELWLRQAQIRPRFGL
ncbi:MAG: asparagine synthase-related protein [Acidobacteriaceae bacterium]